MDGGDDEHMMMMIAAKDMMTSHCVDDGFGGFSTLRKRAYGPNGQNLRNMAHKRRPEMDPRGFDGDAFTGDA